MLEADEQLASAILTALREAAPAAIVDRASSIEDAQRLVMSAKPDLFVLDADATANLGQDFLFDLRTSHPNARAIILTAAHLSAYREQAAGIGAIHFLEKPFPHGDFVDLVGALLRPSSQPDSERFQGTLSELHLADIIQLKCMSGSTSGLEFTGPQGEKARIYFENGQVRHATAPGREGVAAFNEIVNWKGGKISEVSGYAAVPRSIDIDWQVLLMEAVRKLDESGAQRATGRARTSAKRKVLVIDDSLMLANYVKEILSEANYDVTLADTGEEGLRAAGENAPELILLDYLLPDMKGGEVAGRLRENTATADIPVVFMSGFGAELEADRAANPNVIGALNKPFTSDLLLKTVETHLPKSPDEPASPSHEAAPPDLTAQSDAPAFQPENPDSGGAGSTSFAAAGDQPAPIAPPPSDAWWTPPAPVESWPSEQPNGNAANQDAEIAASAAAEPVFPAESFAGGAYFSGDSHFFSLNWALHTISREKLTGVLRCFWTRDPVELFARDGSIVLVTTRDPELYCADAPITLVNVDPDRIGAARQVQAQNGCPLFLTLADEGLILREPAMQLVQHYGQKLFAQLWTSPRVRFVFEQNVDLPSFVRDIISEDDIDHWILSTLRFIQFQELGQQGNYDSASIPAYTKDGFERVQNLRLTVAEAQFASQFNGTRSIAQIAKNLRLDLTFARLTLFRFLALEIVECWSPTTAAQPQKKGMFQRVARSIGIGE